jgi:hypothetical protein
MTNLREIQTAFAELPCPLDLSFKYAIAHMYSVPNPSMIKPVLPLLSPELRSWLTIRNDDIHSFRWADVDYARAFIKAIPGEDKIAGIYMGPDGHPKASSQHLFRALQGASQVMPLITRFFWGDIDIKWYPEACLSHPKGNGFYTVRHFMERISMPGAEVLCIRDWRIRLAGRQPMEQTTPLEIADALDGSAAETLAALESLRGAPGQDSELQRTVNDCEALACLGRYYASKIRGACALALFDANGDKFEHETALRHLGDALAHGKQYAVIRDAHYVPALYNPVGHVDVTALTEKVAVDLDIARNWKPGSLKDDGKRAGSEKGFRK